MLVLSRRKGESLNIGENITITILDTGESIKIGIDAPRTIQIYRSEVFQAIQAENKLSAKTKTNMLELKNLFE